MLSPQRQGWLVVGALFTTLFLVFGSGYNTAGIFFTPLLTEFGWSRAQLSLLQTTLALAAGLVVPAVGWLLDRTDARAVVVAGAALAAAGFLVASQATAFGSMIVGYALVGTGIGASTLLPASMIIANWFGPNRGLALGLAMAGTSTGGMAMTLVASRAIEYGGWRTGYMVLAAPIVAIAIPFVAMTIRTRPPGAREGAAGVARTLPGLTVDAALRGRSFWLIGLVSFLYALAASGTNLHAIPYFIGTGYSAPRAALFMSLVFGIAGVGKLLTGLLADRIGARATLALTFLVCACGLSSLLFAAKAVGTGVFLALFGITIGAPLTLVPLVMAESLGLRRFGSLAGLAGLFNVLGAAVGPVFAGRIFDVSGHYAAAFEVFILALLLAAVATLACLPLGEAGEERAPLVGVA